MTKIIVNKNRKEQPKFTYVANMSPGDCFIDNNGDLMMKTYNTNVVCVTSGRELEYMGSYQVLKELHITTIPNENE